MRNLFFTIATILIISDANAQFANLSGRVMDKAAGKPLPGVSVQVDKTTIATTTDNDGNYSFAIPSGKHTIHYTMVGMKAQSTEVDLQENENKILIILMEDDSKQLGLVVVTAGKFEQKIEDVTVSMNVIKPTMIENIHTTDMDKLLDQVPSVNVIDGQANIRGGSGWSYGAGSRVLVLVDDLPMLTADANDVKWSFLPVENIEQIEVIKGASSALYGSSAMNGVINVRTAFPKSVPQSKVIVYSGIYDTNQKMDLNDTTYNLNWNGKNPRKTTGMSFFHSRQISNLDFVLGGNVFLDDHYKEGSYEKRGRVNCNLRYRFKKIDGLSAGVNMNTQEANGSLFFIWQNDTTGAYRPFGGTDTATTSLSEYTTHRTNVDPYVTYITRNGSTHKLRTRWFRTNNENNTNQESLADLYYGEYQYQRKFSDQFTLTAGLVATSTVINSELYLNHTGSNYAGYLQADGKIFRKLIYSIGGRVEKNKVDEDTDKLTPVLRAGLNYEVFANTHVRASYGQGYRYPSVAEKYVKTEVGLVAIYPNANVESENGFSTELGIMQGLKLGGWNGYIDVAGFWTEYNNMIEYTFGQWGELVPPLYGLGFKAYNVGDTRIKGVDISLAGSGNIGPLNVDLLAGYTYMDPRQLSFDSAYQYNNTLDSLAYLGSDSSNFLKYRYNHLVRADVEVSYRRIGFGISCRYNSFMQNIDKIFVHPVFGSIVAPGVAHYRESHTNGDLVFDMRCSFKLTKEVKLAFIVKNIFNYIYMQRPADMQSPRTFTGQLTVAF
jgi:TonB-dependent SusC/RagA subfamily outer membrane receptor